MKVALEKWLSPEDAEQEGDIISETAEAFDDKPSSNFSLATSKASVKKSKDDAFDSWIQS